MKIPNKREFQQIALNHSADVDFEGWILTKIIRTIFIFIERFNFINRISIKIYEKLVTKWLLVGKSKQPINKIEQNKAQCDLDRQAAKISALVSINAGKYEF